MKINITPHPTKEGWYYLEFRPNGSNGKRVRIPIEGHDNATSERDKLQTLHTRVKPLTTPHLTIAEAAPKYLEWVKQYRAHSTYQNKRARFEIHLVPGLGHLRIANLTQVILDAYGKNMASASYRDDLYHLLALISWMTKRNYCAPLGWKPELPQYSAPVKSVPAPDDILKFIELIPKPDQKTLFSMMLYTGMRWNEVAHLRWENYEGDSFRVVKVKTKKQIKKYIPAHLQQWFKDNQKPEGWVFTHNGRKPYVNLERMLKIVGEKVGIKMTPHLFRHTSATLLYQATGDLYQVKHHLQHSRITTTEIYTRYSIEESKASITALEKHLSIARENGQHKS